MTNTSLLLQYIEESGLKKGYIAKQLGINRYSLAKKIKNENEFLGSEMQKLGELLNLDCGERDRIFFAR